MEDDDAYVQNSRVVEIQVHQSPVRTTANVNDCDSSRVRVVEHPHHHTHDAHQSSARDHLSHGVPDIWDLGPDDVNLAGAANDPDGDTLSYGWTFGGMTATGPSVTTMMTGNGAVTIQLTVNDGHGNTVNQSTTATIGTMTGTWAFTVPSDGCGTGNSNPLLSP